MLIRQQYEDAYNFAHASYKVEEERYREHAHNIDPSLQENNGFGSDSEEEEQVATPAQMAQSTHVQPPTLANLSTPGPKGARGSIPGSATAASAYRPFTVPVMETSNFGFAEPVKDKKKKKRDDEDGEKKVGCPSCFNWVCDAHELEKEEKGCG